MKIGIRSGLLACVLLLATSCVNGHRTEKIPVNIGFRPVIGHDTRADREESVPFPEDRDFKVWASDIEEGTVVMDAMTISHGPDGWMASLVWPETVLSFDACWPTDIAASYSPEDGISIKGFDTSKDGRDLLMAMNETDYEIDSLVTLKFDHLLSRIEFRAMSSLDENMEVCLKKISIKGFSFNGDYNVEGSRIWTVGASDDAYDVFDAGDGEGIMLDRGMKYLGDDFFVIPQLFDGDVVMECMIRVGSGDWIPDKLSATGIRTDWQPGKLYTYTFNLTDSKLTHTTGISSWTNIED